MEILELGCFLSVISQQGLNSPLIIILIALAMRRLFANAGHQTAVDSSGSDPRVQAMVQMIKEKGGKRKYENANQRMKGKKHTRMNASAAETEENLCSVTGKFVQRHITCPALVLQSVHLESGNAPGTTVMSVENPLLFFANSAPTLFVRIMKKEQCSSPR